jgi:alpha-beta hydrolase superfamily lysophospholipase
VKTGHTAVDIKLFQDARHEILNEINKEEVYDYIDNFIETKVIKK